MGGWCYFAIVIRDGRSGRPWKPSMELNYDLEQPDAFGPEWMIGFDIAPVVEISLVNRVK